MTAREILDSIRRLTATEFLGLASTLTIEPHTLLRLATPEPVKASGPLDVRLPEPYTQFGGNYGLVLTDVGVRKIQVIKVIREFTGFGLKESKDCVDVAATGAPVVLSRGQRKVDANDFASKLREQGATVLLVDDGLPF